ncbi:MAG: response regulator [Candidatus Cloacimonetes bacterium]|jgi:DNA-binding NtrC family response regulator|nr:response regulator [Candidatus Cloacimonadota bacterium]MDY0298942.1 response regulator [Candidatus Cloacimonadaceae bacterium]MCB5278789.1 response regulator [Candidatus Cloacimonadota bacterium]MCK9332795.1 response regulator [Candidatus Cloacimonadota bacterium]MDD2210182.1 response regulator [Candidatus Cloacimonadota bacterium]
MEARILLVDDDRLLREVISECLKLNDYQVDMAEDATAALKLFQPDKYDLALIDLVMPGMNGLELMQKIMEEDANIFCLIMTGYPTVDSAYKAMVEGASDYIIKPFQLNELVAAIKQHLES